MQIHGYNKTTLLDFPGHVATTVFTGACNFRCPFCHNADLVLDPSSQPLISEDEIMDHLKKRRGIVTGVCVTGGEPTLQKDLKEFLERIKELNLLIKLDTNGYRPEVLKDLVNSGLVDYVAMDIKSSLSCYPEAAGVDVNTDLVKESIDFLINGSADYEFRTTVVRELHSSQNFKDLAETLKGAKRYFLQGYIDSDRVISRVFTSYTREELESFLPLLSSSVKEVSIRGVD